MKQIRIADWKTGWKEANAVDQLKAYGWLALKKYPDAESVWAVLAWVRTGQADIFEWTRAELDAWKTSVDTRLADKTFRPGTHCSWCPRALECPARTLFFKTSYQLMPMGAAVEFWNAGILPTDPTERAPLVQQLLERAKQIGKWAEAVAEQCKADVRAHGGKLGQMEIVEERRTQIDYTSANSEIMYFLEKLARNHCGSTEYCDRYQKEAVSISKTKLEQIARDGAEKGHKAATVKELMDRLEQAGALKKTVTEKLIVRGNNEQRITVDTDDTDRPIEDNGVCAIRGPGSD